jgi:cold shock CspA family protein
MAKATRVHSTAPTNTSANPNAAPNRLKSKTGDRPRRRSDVNRFQKIAALDFEPVFQPSAGFLRAYGDDTFVELGITTRTAILLLSANKSQMVKAAADRGEDAWFRMLEDLHLQRNPVRLRQLTQKRIRSQPKRQKAAITWFNATKSYGFIAPGTGGKDVFAHISAVERSSVDLRDGDNL